MAYNSVHIIQKQSYEIAAPNFRQALRLQHELEDINLVYVLPAISKKLDELFSKDEIVIIDKLVLNIGRVQSDKSQEWLEKIIKELETSVNTQFLLKTIEETFEAKKLNRSQHAILIWIYFLQTGLLRAETEFKSVNEVKEAIMQLDDISKMTLKNELIENHSSIDFMRRLALLEPEELFFFIKLFMPSTAKKDWIDFLKKVKLLINTVKRTKKKPAFQNVAEIQNNVLASVVRIIINAAKEDKYFCLDELIIIAEENLKRFIAERK
jgi:Contractile injection system tape measure protein